MKKLTTLFILFLGIISSAQDFQGTWKAKLLAGGQTIDLVLHINSDKNQYTTLLDIPKQGATGIKAETTEVIDKEINIKFTSIGITISGELSPENTIQGAFEQQGFTIPITFEKGNLIINRPQEPKSPFAYNLEDFSLTTSDGIQLAGTITTPKNQKTFPVVLLLSGSGPQNRDSELFGHKPFLLLSDYLTKNGIGVIRFDERGTGLSTGNFKDADLKTQRNDIQSILNFAKNHKAVKDQKIGILGHSIGGLIAPQMANLDKNIAFLVLLAAPGINGDVLMLEQKAAFEKGLGVTEFQIAQGQTFMKSIYDHIRGNSKTGKAFEEDLNQFMKEKYANLLPQDQIVSISTSLSSPEVVDLLRSNPSQDLEKLKIPVLALNGDKDFQVVSKSNLPAMENALKKSGNKQNKFVEFKGLNHLFQTSKTGLLSEYGEIEETMSPLVLKTISDWISGLK